MVPMNDNTGDCKSLRASCAASVYESRRRLERIVELLLACLQLVIVLVARGRVHAIAWCHGMNVRAAGRR